MGNLSDALRAPSNLTQCHQCGRGYWIEHPPEIYFCGGTDCEMGRAGIAYRELYEEIKVQDLRGVLRNDRLVRIVEELREMLAEILSREKETQC